jgi:hypothetical protein
MLTTKQLTAQQLASIRASKAREREQVEDTAFHYLTSEVTPNRFALLMRNKSLGPGHTQRGVT